MSGLPLNAQITEPRRTLAAGGDDWAGYQLFALGNRPGLVRTPDGGSIAGEVWALPTCAIGALLAQVPPPLGFGTVVLDDGPCLGFLAEFAGVAGVPDITALVAGAPGCEAIRRLTMDDTTLDALIDAGTATLGSQ